MRAHSPKVHGLDADLPSETRSYMSTVASLIDGGAVEGTDVARTMAPLMAPCRPVCVPYGNWVFGVSAVVQHAGAAECGRPE
jgi:hypothetical protein